jgi:hypothetical protein
VSRREAVALDALRHHEASVYAIGANSRQTKLLPADRLALEKLTQRSGGDLLVVESEEGVAAAAERIGDELRFQYVFGLVPGARW